MDIIEEDSKHIVYRCPSCGSGSIVIDLEGAHMYGYCNVCDAAYIHYVPLEHQKAVHEDKHKLKLLLGG